MNRTRMGARALARSVTAAVAVMTLLAGSAGVASAHGRHHADPRVTVMTQNLYLGANLTPLFGPTGADLVQQAAIAYAHVVQTDFPARAEAIADEIASARPDLVGLQEVALWRTAPLSDPSQMTTTYDFLQILLDALAADGHPYRVVAVNTNFSGMLPIGPATLASFTDRDAIIIRADRPRLHVSNPRSGTYAAGVPVAINGSPITIPRGWSSVDVRVHGLTFRFANTHLEAYSDVIRGLQAGELATTLSGSPHPVVLAGDLNDLPGTGSVATLQAAGLRDGWIGAMGDVPGYTAGQTDDLDNVPSTIDHTVDYVMVGRSIHPVRGSGDIVGEELADRTTSGLWPSDHAGVVLRLRLARRCG
jgi:endonuclease/exonuclease/phosphatase family metal-dependent hydrolase